MGCRMMRVPAIVALCLSLLWSWPANTQAQGGITIGVEAGMYDTVVAGVQGWNAAGVGFTVEATGCGTGDVTFCYSADPWSFGGSAEWIAWYPIGGSVIYVSTVSNYAFVPSSVCHELGHWLGLHYHRSDYQSCMSSPASDTRPASPDDADLANLGLSWVEPQEITQFPNTGSGPDRRP